MITGSEFTKRLLGQFWPKVGFIFILLVGLLAVLSPYCAPDSSLYANAQHPELCLAGPGTQYIEYRLDATANFQSLKSDAFQKKIMLHKYFIQDTLFKYSLLSSPETTIQCSLPKAVFGNNLFSYQYKTDNSGYQIVLKNKSQPVFFSMAQLKKQLTSHQILHRRFILGSDKLGRDYLSRLIWGARVSMSVGFIAVLVSLAMGLFMGSLAGYFGRRMDHAISWLMNVIWSLPTILLIGAISMLLGKGLFQIYLAIGLTMWVDTARLVRGQILSIKQKEFVEAGTVLGYSKARILMRHIWPNLWSSLLIYAAANFSTAILTEAGLSFLGFGAQPPIPSWGEMISAHKGYMLLDKAYLALIPGFAVTSLLLSFIVFSQGVRNALNPRYKNA